MRLELASYQILSELNRETILKTIERAIRVAYKSEDKISFDLSSAQSIIKTVIDRGHESTLEHFSFSVLFKCDRGISHELVRHRLASFVQESSRYCNYSATKFSNEITFIIPSIFNEVPAPINYEENNAYYVWHKSCEQSEMDYFNLLRLNIKPQIARDVLNHSLKTEVVVTANIREWRHILKLRTSKEAHPDMWALMIPLLKELQFILPDLFSDIQTYS